MKLTAITGNLNQRALRKLTLNATNPEYKALKVRTTLSLHDLEGHPPAEIGEFFHRTSAVLLGGGQLPPGGRTLYPFVEAIRGHLRSLGYSTFLAEYGLRSGSVTGRADLIARGVGRNAVVEYKVTDMPWEPDAGTMVQAASYGYMLPSHFEKEPTALIIYYVDLRRRRVESYRWQNFRDVAFQLRELRAA